jgi:hypothetical protein
MKLVIMGDPGMGRRTFFRSYIEGKHGEIDPATFDIVRTWDDFCVVRRLKNQRRAAQSFPNRQKSFFSSPIFAHQARKNQFPIIVLAFYYVLG